MLTWGSHSVELAENATNYFLAVSSRAGHLSLFLAAEHLSSLLKSKRPSSVQGGAYLPPLDANARCVLQNFASSRFRREAGDGKKQGSRRIHSASSGGHIQVELEIVLTSMSSVQCCWLNDIQCKLQCLCSALDWLWGRHHRASITAQR